MFRHKNVNCSWAYDMNKIKPTSLSIYNRTYPFQKYKQMLIMSKSYRYKKFVQVAYIIYTAYIHISNKKKYLYTVDHWFRLISRRWHIQIVTRWKKCLDANVHSVLLLTHIAKFSCEKYCETKFPIKLRNIYILTV